MSTSRVPEGGAFRLQLKSLARDAWVIVGSFPSPSPARRLAEDLVATGTLKAVKVEHRNGGTWKPVWGWLASAGLLLLTMSGCATGGVAGLSSLGREVNLTPARGQRVEQIRQDDAECVAWTRATKGTNEPLPDATLRYAACALARGYTVQPWGSTVLLVPGHEPVTAPETRTLEAVLADMRGCGAAQTIGYEITDTWGSPAERRVACLTCLEQRGYHVERRKETSR